MLEHFRAVRGALFLLGALMGSLPAGAAEGWTISGCGFGDSEFLPALRESAETARSEALSRLRVRLGLEPGSVPVEWVLDATLSGQRLLEGSSGADTGTRYFEAGRTDFRGEGVRVLIPVRRYLTRLEELRVVVAHEAAHGVLASALGTEERYRNVPRWFREGLALWFSGEGEVRVAERLASVLVAGGGSCSFLRGLAPGRGSTPEEGYLALCWIESRVGDDGLARICRGVARGSPVEEQIREVLGDGGASFRARALAHARRTIRERCPPEMERRFLDSLRRYREGETESVLPVWKELLEERPDGPLRDTLEYLLGKEILAGAESPKDVEKARWHLERVRRSPGDLWRPEALLLLGEALERQGRRTAAQSLWEEVVRAHPEDRAVAAKARENLKRAATSTGERDR